MSTYWSIGHAQLTIRLLKHFFDHQDSEPVVQRNGQKLEQKLYLGWKIFWDPLNNMRDYLCEVAPTRSRFEGGNSAAPNGSINLVCIATDFRDGPVKLRKPNDKPNKPNWDTNKLYTYQENTEKSGRRKNKTAVTVPVEDLLRSLNDGKVQEFRNVMFNRIAEARIMVISEYLEWCSSEVSPPFRVMETLSTLRSVICRAAIHETHQLNFAKTLQRFLSASSGDIVLAVLDEVIKKMLEVYTPVARLARPHIRGLQLYPYLDNPVAREIIKDTFIENKNTVTAMDPPLPDLLSSICTEEIINSLDFMHPPRD
ncbi:hypothetical protein C8R45DRAFT_934452 [Mycena sanguinolenta]|nr:hypothetical protein C8R45DRAFT_934452 [Mycena sanguinolenta]